MFTAFMAAVFIILSSCFIELYEPPLNRTQFCSYTFFFDVLSSFHSSCL